MMTATLTAEEENRYAELQAMALDAARKGDTEMLRPMLDAGLPIGLSDEKGNSLLMLATYHGNAETARLLLEQGADPDQRNDRHQTPLAGVAFKGYPDLAKLLVEHGADAAADQGGGRRPIDFAALFGHTEIVRYLESVSASHKRRRLVFLSRTSRLIRKMIRR
ncbi:ankyrin repeat domain-containing protein [Luteolibacter pohnpeiensis]|uniref:Ankyrin repeat domain-containing protein n=1 Tax=Luteolibacter pohnpeiensis TaxID=454153 RepID=A0A934VX75_9BACT|nr:ankyrin repeat domain-containing protein [Luteolibacter pohnpeiensis]MBK1883249.1 ankyrin repeat domain-containing protein [Luteolibacter pohnpeiensis]